MSILKSLFDFEYKELKRFMKIADQIEAKSDEYEKLTDKQLQNKTEEFKKELENGKTLDDILVDAFATVREAAKRVINEKPFYTQLLGALAIHYGNIAEMKTGEGKTLTSVMPAYLNALTGKGVHIVTVNEYLASRDAAWMGQIFEFLGLTVGTNLRDLSPAEKRERYNCDVLYSTNNEIGFDYLRDNMVVRKEDRVQRPLNFAIVDEVDSVLIDEARTPLIISGGAMHSNNQYLDAQRFVKDLKENQEIELKDISLEIPTEVIHTNNIVLNYVFNRYTEIMKEHQIDFYGTYSDQIYQGVSSYDLATILKFLLDHAIVLSQKTTHKAIHYTIESQRYYTIIKIRCLIENEIVVDYHFKKNEYLIEEICRKYNGKKLSKIEDNQYMFGCYLENSGDLL